MTLTETRRYLSDYRATAREIPIREAELRGFAQGRDRALQTSATEAEREKLRDMYGEALRALEKAIAEAAQRRAELDALLQPLDAPARAACYARYALGLEWARVPEHTFYSQRQSQTHETRGVEKIRRALEERTERGNGFNESCK